MHVVRGTSFPTLRSRKRATLDGWLGDKYILAHPILVVHARRRHITVVEFRNETILSFRNATSLNH